MAAKPKPVETPPPRPAVARPPATPAPKTWPYALAGLKRTPEGYVVVVAKFDGADELQELTQFDPPEALKQYAVTRLIRKIKGL